MKKFCLILLCMVMVLSMMVSFAGCDKEKKDKTVVTTKELRIGILSDIHTNTLPVYRPLERFEKALRFFKEKGVDGILVTGDLLDTFNHVDLLSLQDVWLDGTKISRIYRGATYQITIHKGSGKMLVDGQEMDGNIVPIFPADTTHTVEVWC